MLKGFVSGEEKDIVRIPMRTKQLYDDRRTETTAWKLKTDKFIIGCYGNNKSTTSSNIVSYSISENQITVASGSGGCGIGVIVEIENDKTYTLSFDTSKELTGDSSYFGFNLISESGSLGTYVAPPATKVYTFNSGSAKYAYFVFRVAPQFGEITYSNIMLNLGTTPLPYEPYGYQEGWEVRDNEDRLIWGREDELQTATGTLPFKGYSLPMKVKSLLGNAVQNGTPSPSPVNLNLVDPSATVPGYQESNGNIHEPSSGNERTTDWIPFTTDALYAIVSGSNSGNINWVLYDSSKQPLYFYGPTFSPNTVIIISRSGYSTAAFIRISWTNAANQPICVTTEQRSEYIAFDPNPPGPVIPEMCGVRTENLYDKDNPSKVYCYYGDARNDFVANSNNAFVVVPVEAGKRYYVSGAKRYNSSTPIRYCTSFSEPANGVSVVRTGTFAQASGLTIDIDSGEKYLAIFLCGDSDYSGYGSVNSAISANGEDMDISNGWKIPFENHGENLFDTSTDVNNGYIDNSYLRQDGTVSGNQSQWYVSCYIKVSAGETYTYKPNHSAPTNPSICYYDETKSYVSTLGVAYGRTFTVPSGVSYVRFSVNKSGYDIMLTPGSTALPYSPYLNETLPVYLGEIPTVRRVKKLVLTGEENWSGYYGVVYLYNIINYLKTDAAIAICTHYQPQPSIIGVTETNAGHIAFSKGANYRLCIRDNNYTTESQFKSYLASEYAAGHPVTIWYVLANEQTGISNEPLCKISTYADELTTIQVHGLSAPLYGIGDYKDTLNLSTGVVTRKVKRLVLDGTEAWIEWKGNYYSSVIDSTAISNSHLFCTHFINDNTAGMNIGAGASRLKIASAVVPFVTSVGDLKAWLTAQYQAGTPVTIWYVLDTPTTETVTVPTGMTGGIEGYLTQVSTPTPTNRSVPKWNGVEETGGTYAVTVYTPPEIPTTTGQNTLTVDTTLAPSKLEVSVHAKKIHYGFKIDKSNDNSEDAVIYTHDAVTMTPAHMDFENDRFDYGSWGNAFFVRDCYPVALNLDGTEAYRLDPDDYTKKMDGTPSDIFYELLTEEPSDWSTQWKQYYTKSGNEYVLNGQSTAPTFATDTYYKLTYTSSFTGNFMMAFPKVWFYRHEDSQYNYIEISNHRLSDDWKCYAHINANGQEVDFIYLPLFKGVIKDSKLRSLPGQIPQGNTTATTEANAAAALGSRWQIWDHSSVECLNDLLTLMSKSIDSQGRFGQGRSTGYDSTDTVTYGKLQSGTLIKKGKFHGYSATTKEVKVFGLEGFWANRWDRLQGMLLVDNVWKIKMEPPYNFAGTDFVTLSNAEVPSGNGYLSKVQTSEYGSIPASIANGSSTKYFRDYFYKTATNTRVVIRGGNCYYGGYAGFRYVSVYGAASSSGWHIGASPVYK